MPGSERLLGGIRVALTGLVLRWLAEGQSPRGEADHEHLRIGQAPRAEYSATVFVGA